MGLSENIVPHFLPWFMIIFRIQWPFRSYPPLTGPLIDRPEC
jgi:hypothetical protein